MAFDSKAFRALAKQLEKQGDAAAKQGEGLAPPAALANIQNGSLLYSLAMALNDAASDLDKQHAQLERRLG
jgi:hypothetical protein